MVWKGHCVISCLLIGTTTLAPVNVVSRTGMERRGEYLCLGHDEVNDHFSEKHSFFPLTPSQVWFRILPQQKSIWVVTPFFPHLHRHCFLFGRSRCSPLSSDSEGVRQCMTHTVPSCGRGWDPSIIMVALVSKTCGQCESLATHTSLTFPSACMRHTCEGTTWLWFVYALHLQSESSDMEKPFWRSTCSIVCQKWWRKMLEIQCPTRCVMQNCRNEDSWPHHPNY